MRAGERTVLLVEDDAQLLAAYQRALDAGFELLAARTSEDAKRLASAHSIDIAIVDMQLGCESGLDVIAHIRQHHPNATITLITGYGSIEAGADAIRAGADHVMAKPVTLAELLRRVDGTARSPRRRAATPSIDRAIWEHVMRVLKDCGGNKSQTARLLRMNRSTLQRWLNRQAPRS